jgi:hypothetical protein
MIPITPSDRETQPQVMRTILFNPPLQVGHENSEDSVVRRQNEMYKHIIEEDTQKRDVLPLTQGY